MGLNITAQQEQHYLDFAALNVEMQRRAYTFRDEVITNETLIRVPSLFQDGRQGQIYSRSRHGLETVVYHTKDLAQGDLQREEQDALTRYLFAQYLHPAVGFFDPLVAYQNQLRQEPVDSFFNNGDVHVIVGSGDGQIVGYIGVKGPDESGVVYGQRSQPTAEDLLYNKPYQSNKVIQDTPADMVREMRRFVVRNTLQGFLPATVSLELCVALFGVCPQLNEEVKIIVGDFDPSVTYKNLSGVMGIPIAMFPGNADVSRLSAPYDKLLAPRYAKHNVVPLAFSTSDLNVTQGRVTALDRELDHGIVQGVRKAVEFSQSPIENMKSSLATSPEV